jgi:hypothetical protein
LVRVFAGRPWSYRHGCYGGSYRGSPAQCTRTPSQSHGGRRYAVAKAVGARAHGQNRRLTSISSSTCPTACIDRLSRIGFQMEIPQIRHTPGVNSVAVGRSEQDVRMCRRGRLTWSSWVGLRVLDEPCGRPPYPLTKKRLAERCREPPIPVFQMEIRRSRRPRGVSLVVSA